MVLKLGYEWEIFIYIYYVLWMSYNTFFAFIIFVCVRAEVMKAIPYILVGLIRKILHTCGFPAAAAIASSHKEQRASSFNTYYVPTYLGR